MKKKEEIKVQAELFRTVAKDDEDAAKKVESDKEAAKVAKDLVVVPKEDCEDKPEVS